MEEAIGSFVECRNYQRYHEGSGKATPCDAHRDTHLDAVHRSKGVKNRTLLVRRAYNRVVML